MQNLAAMQCTTDQYQSTGLFTGATVKQKNKTPRAASSATVPARAKWDQRELTGPARANWDQNPGSAYQGLTGAIAQLQAPIVNSATTDSQ